MYYVTLFHLVKRFEISVYIVNCQNGQCLCYISVLKTKYIRQKKWKFSATFPQRRGVTMDVADSLRL